MSETTIAQVSRTFAAPSLGKQALFRVTAQAYLLSGNQHPHFSVEGEAWTAGGCGRREDRIFCCGCMHEEALRFWPAVKPIVDLHLSNADDGEPMHAEANGWYWLAGTIHGGAGEWYHGGNSSPARSEDDCRRILGEHLRITPGEVEAIRARVVEILNKRDEYTIGYPNVCKAARKVFADYVETLRPRWAAEAAAGLELIRKLAAEQQAKAA